MEPTQGMEEFAEILKAQTRLSWARQAKKFLDMLSESEPARKLIEEQLERMELLPGMRQFREAEASKAAWDRAVERLINPSIVVMPEETVDKLIRTLERLARRWRKHRESARYANPERATSMNEIQRLCDGLMPPSRRRRSASAKKSIGSSGAST